MDLELFMKTVLLTSLVLAGIQIKSVKSGDFFQVTDLAELDVVLVESLQRKDSLLQCLLTATTKSAFVTTVGYQSSTNRCLLYRDAIYDEDSNDLDTNDQLRTGTFDFYKKEAMKNVQSTENTNAPNTCPTISTTTVAVSCADSYKTGVSCTITKDLKTMLNEKCHLIDPNQDIAVYANIQGTYRWRCHASSTLTSDQLFFTGGTAYNENAYSQLKELVDNHPEYKNQIVTLSASGQSCENQCKEKQKTCQLKPFTLNSIYFFSKAGYDCHQLDTTVNGSSYWKQPKEPVLRSDGYCTGFAFVDLQSFSCEAEPYSNERRVCQCY